MNEFRHAARGLQAAAIVLLIAACGGGGGGGGVGAPADPAAAGTIGAAGGEVAFADGRFRLAIPAGALAAPTAITVTELTAANVPANLRSINADRVYRLEPAGTQFAVPAMASVALPVSPSGAIAVMALESNGSGEYAASQLVTISTSGRTVAGSVPHFSNLVVKTVDSFTVNLSLASKSIAAGGPMVANLSLAKSASGESGTLTYSSFTVEPGKVTPLSAGPISVSTDAPPPTPVGFDRNLARTVTGTYAGTCASAGTGYVGYRSEINDAFIDTFVGFGGADLSIAIQIADDYECTAGADTGSAVATGVFPTPLGLTGPDGVRVFRGPFANLGSGPFAAFAGAQGMIVIDLLTRLSVLNWTPGGAAGAKLGPNLIGTLPVKQPGATGIAAFFGYGNGGSALTNYVSAINGFGATGIGSAQVLDAATAGGGLDANAFLSVGARGIEFFAYDAASQLYGGGNFGSISSTAVDGQMVSAAAPAESGPIYVLTRQADGGAASKLYKVSPSSGLPGLPVLQATFDSPQARALRCFSTGELAACVATLFGGQARFFNHDPAATAPPAILTVPTAAGSLGVDGLRRANGNLAVVVANFDAGSATVIETTPDASALVGSKTLPAPPGCVKPAHPAVFTDSEGSKALVSCFGSDSYWVFRF